MDETELPHTGIDEDVSDRLQEYTQKTQEQAFLLGYRNGFREGEMVQELLGLAKQKQEDVNSPEEAGTWGAVEQFLIERGAFIDDEEDTGEITHPPGLNLYLGGFEAQPFCQVAGERVHVDAFHFDWLPNADDPEEDTFEPANESAVIELELHLDLPEDSTQREALMEFLEGLR